VKISLPHLARIAIAVSTISLAPVLAQSDAQKRKELDDVYEKYDLQLKNGRYAAALTLSQIAVDLCGKYFGTDTDGCTWTLNNRAYAYRRLGKYTEAEATYRQILVIKEKALGSDHQDVAQALHDIGLAKQDQRRYGEAESFYKRALAIREKANRPNDLKLAYTVDNLGIIYLQQGKLADAETFFRRSLAIWEKAPGAKQSDLARVVHDLGVIRQRQERYADAADFYKRAISIEERIPGANEVLLARTLNNLADTYWWLDNYAEAEALYKRALALRDRILRPDDDETLLSLDNLAGLYVTIGNIEGYPRERELNQQAQPLYERALSTRERKFGKDQVAVADTLQKLARIERALDNFDEAKAKFDRALSIYEARLGKNDPKVAVVLKMTGDLLHEQRGRQREAEEYYQRAIDVKRAVLSAKESEFGKKHVEVADALMSLGNSEWEQFRTTEAEEHFARALTIKEGSPGPDTAQVADICARLGSLYRFQKRYAEAETMHQRALSIREKALGPQHSAVGRSLRDLASLFGDQEKYAETEIILQRLLSMYPPHGSLSGTDDLYKAAFQILDKTKQPNTPHTLSKIALLYAHLGDPKHAVVYARKSAESLVAHTAGNNAKAKQSNETDRGLEAVRKAYLVNHLGILDAAAQNNLASPGILFQEAMLAVQWISESSAGRAVVQMAERFASGGGELARLVRESQDLDGLWREKDNELIQLRDAGGRARSAFDALKRQIADIEQRRTKVLADLKLNFPEYVGFARSTAAPMNEVADLIGSDEALIFWEIGEKESHVFVLIPWMASNGLGSNTRWKKIPVGAEALAKIVTRFRSGLDIEEVRNSIKARGDEALFDLKAARELYELLLGPVEDIVKEKHHLLIVPSGVLTAVPFHLLLTKAPPETKAATASQYREADWLIKEHAITVLPSVASLKALRVFANKQHAEKPMIGFGDPVFARDAEPRAKSARLTTRAYTEFWKGGEVDRNNLANALPRLSETADELRAVAQSLGSPLSSLYLREAASEANVKRLPLADYRLIYFATHGLVAGDVKGLTEPALALTLPKTSTPNDDGLLTASEISRLRLNADWVILSACNTIAGERPGAEALSGLARAFFYAGARSLLVSHWAVDSTAAQRLTTSVFKIMQSDPLIGRSEALRRAMLDYMNDPSDPLNAYPAFWAPFILVGEGWNPATVDGGVFQEINKQRSVEQRKEEEARLAPSCEPLKDQAISILKQSSPQKSGFDRSATLLQELAKPISDGCSKKVRVFSGEIEEIIPCYNQAFYIKLRSGGQRSFGIEPGRSLEGDKEEAGFVINDTTNSFAFGAPRKAGEWLIGLSDEPYYCLKSVVGMEVLAARLVKALAHPKGQDN
jgi:CHAT domain-containing protein